MLSVILIIVILVTVIMLSVMAPLSIDVYGIGIRLVYGLVLLDVYESNDWFEPNERMSPSKLEKPVSKKKSCFSIDIRVFGIRVNVVSSFYVSPFKIGFILNRFVWRVSLKLGENWKKRKKYCQ